MGAFAEPGTAKVETKRWQPEGRKHLGGVVDDLVVQRTAVQRVRVCDERGKGGVGSPGIEDGFQTPGGSAKISDGLEL